MVPCLVEAGQNRTFLQKSKDASKEFERVQADSRVCGGVKVTIFRNDVCFDSHQLLYFLRVFNWMWYLCNSCWGDEGFKYSLSVLKQTTLIHSSLHLQSINGNPPHADKIGFRRRYCNSTMEPTLPKEAWTMNIAAIDGSVNDSYRFGDKHFDTWFGRKVYFQVCVLCRYNPWRAPGYAPVVDACGQAGGKYKQTPVGGDSVFTTTKFATMGDLGSHVLPKGPPTATWKAGQNAPVTWGIRYNHGGGYQVFCFVATELLHWCKNPHLNQYWILDYQCFS